MSRNLDSALPKSEMTPRDVGFPYLWVDAADSTKRVLNTSNELIGVVDKSHFGHYFGQSVPGAASHPSATVLGSKGAFTTTAINGLFAAGVPMPLTEVTMFFVYDGNDGTLLETEAEGLVVSDAAITVGSATGAAPAKLSDADTHILMVYWDAASGELWYKFDEDAKVLLDTDTTRLTLLSDDVYLMNTDGDNNGVTGAVGEIIMYPTKLPAFQMNRVGKYLCTKWNALWADV